MENVKNYVTNLRAYFRAGDTMAFSKHDNIMELNEHKRSIFYISSGYLRIYSKNRRGDEYTHIIYGPGEMFPFTWMTRIERTDVQYEALTDIKLFVKSFEQFEADLLSINGLAYGTLQQSVEQYRTYTMRVDNLEYKFASERLAYSLVLMANRFGVKLGDNTMIVPVLTHHLIGSTLNLSRESVSREMEKLIRKGLVKYNATRQIILTDVQELSREVRMPYQPSLLSKQ